MRFSSYFETDFLSNEKISLIKVLCSEQKKSFHLELKGEKLLSIDSLKKLVTGIKKIQEERVMRKYDVTYSISYDDLRSDDENLYLEYYRVLLTEICVDYELLSLSSYGVEYNSNVYKLIVSDSSKINQNAINKAIKLFENFGLKVEFKTTTFDKDAILEIKKELTRGK